jgi:hypothetical protein
MLLAFVLLPHRELPDPNRLRSALESWKLPVDAIEPGEVLSATLPIGTLFVAHMPAPIPKGEADSAARFSVGVFRPNAMWAPHVTHLVVSVVGGEPKKKPTLAATKAFTRAVAAVAEATDAVGVYWGNGNVAHEASFFRSIAADSEFPLMLWTGVSLARSATEVSLLTTGLRQFELPDIMMNAPAKGGNAALAYLFDLATYVIERGKAIPDGDTVGRTARERVPVRYEPSPMDPSAKVAVIRLRE